MGSQNTGVTMDSFLETHTMDRTGLVVRAVENALDDVGEIGQTGVVWFSMGVAMWQMILMARHLIFSAELPLAGVLGQPLPEEGKTLVGGNVRDMIEMGFWALRFLEGFEQRYEKDGRAGVDDDDDDATERVGGGQIWSSNARAFLKLMRYITKFLGTYEKFYKNNS